MKKLLIQYKSICVYAALLGISYLTGLSLAIVCGYGITGIEVIIPCLMIFAGIVYQRALPLFSPKNLRYAAPVGFLFALTLVLGSKIEIYDGIFYDFSLVDVVIFPFLGFFFTALILLLFSFSDKICVSTKNCESVDAEVYKTIEKEKGKRFISWICNHLFLSLCILYTLCYLPYYLTFFPGNCGPDTWESIRMVLGEIPWTNHHPVLFTGLLMVVIKGTAFLPLTGSVGVFSFLQMVSLAAVLACLTVRIFKMQVPVVVKIFTVLMFAFHPFIGMYSIYLTKDVFFAEIMVLLCLKLYDIIKEEGALLGKPSECIKLSVLFLFSSMLRNNGLYITIVMAVVLLCSYKKYRKQIAALFVCAVGLFLIWQGPVFAAIGIEKQSFAEAASIPLQQVGYVLWEGGTFSEEDMDFLEELMPVEKVKEVYQPGYTDMYKFDEEFNDAFLNENTGRFLGVWWNGCKNHLGSYIKAYLMQTVGYWHYGETNSVCTQGITANTLGVEQIDVISNGFGFSSEPVMEKLVLAGRKAPVICILGSMAMQIFMVLLLIIQYLRRKNGRFILWLLPLVLLWGTIMIATPAFCLLRYMYPLFLLWPFFLATFFEAEENIQ